MKKLWVLIILIAAGVFYLKHPYQAAVIGEKIKPYEIKRVPAAKAKQSAESALGETHVLSTKGNWKYRYDSNNRVTTLHGGLIPGILKSTDSALVYAKKLKDNLGLSEVDIIVDTEFTAGDDHPLSIARNFKQLYKGHEVYDSYIRLFGRKADGALYYVNNELKVIEQANIEQRFDLDHIQNVIISKYSDKAFEFEKLHAKPIIYVTDSGNAELVWKVIVNVSSPLRDRREILVSAFNAQILKDSSYVILN